jgi:HEAT repeat protein
LKTSAIGGRALKRVVLELLQADDLMKSLQELQQLPGKQVINPLFAFLLNSDERVRWRAVIGMGAVVDSMAQKDMESARVVMRRLMWSLNDESGGIGWGAPEAMAEIMASNSAVAKEFIQVFTSYFNPDGNYLEYEVLQRGLLWGLVRLALDNPEIVGTVGSYLSPYLESSDATVKGLAVWAAGLLRSKDCGPKVRALLDDASELRVYFSDRFRSYSVRELAGESLKQIESAEVPIN